jgi:hypothetical protein
MQRLTTTTTTTLSFSAAAKQDGRVTDLGGFSPTYV